MNNLEQNSDICIVGAGLTGCLLGVYLAKRGHTVSIYDRRPDLRVVELDAGRSINLALANRGIRALEKVGLGTAVAQLMIPMRGRMIHTLDEAPQFQSYGQRESEVIYSISRPGLNKLLMDNAEYEGAEIHFEHQCIDIDIATPCVHIEDINNERLLKLCKQPIFAADGAGSIIRRRMAEQGEIHSVEDMLAHGYKELTIPAGINDEYQLDPNALHIWPRGGFMLIALPNLGGSFTATLFMPLKGETSFESLASPEAVEDFFERTFPDALKLMPQLTQEYFDNPVGYMGTVRCSPWRSGSGVVLIGDAAHAIVPFHGQGMNCAFEDCFDLNQYLQEPGLSWSEVFARFEQIRKPNADAIADLALENYVEMRDTVRDPAFHLKKSLAFELERLYPEVFIPRYSMVMFHHIPYAEAQRRGSAQQKILDRLIQGQQSVDTVDYDLAAQLIKDQLLPLVTSPP